jgi:trigger factor
LNFKMMQVTKEQTAPCTINLSIEIDAETVSQAFDRAYREFSKFTNVPGFRPGKAPRSILEKYVQPSRVQERVKDMLVSKAYREAVEQNEIVPYDDPRADLEDVEDGKPWSFKAEVPLAPVIELGDLSTITAVKPVYEIREDDIDQAIRKIIEEHERIVKVEGRGVQEKDILMAEIKSEVAGKESSEEPSRTVIRMGENPPEFEQHILGQNIDEERRFTIMVPERVEEGQPAGELEEVHYYVKVLSINEPVLPELTDEWVKSVTPLQSINELREEIRQSLQADADKTSKSIAYQNVIDKLIDISKIEYPDILVDRQARKRFNSLMESIEESQISFEEYLEQIGKTEEELMKEMYELAENQVKVNLALSRILETENIEVSKDEVLDELTKIAMNSRSPEEQLKRMMSDRDSVTLIANKILLNKVEEFIMSKVTLTEEIVKD